MQDAVFLKNVNHSRPTYDARSTQNKLNRAFPDLGGSDLDFRKLSLVVSGTISNILEGRLEIDFAYVQDIKDNWIHP
jgi:hypothetical protein